MRWAIYKSNRHNIMQRKQTTITGRGNFPSWTSLLVASVVCWSVSCDYLQLQCESSWETFPYSAQVKPETDQESPVKSTEFCGFLDKFCFKWPVVEKWALVLPTPPVTFSAALAVVSVGGLLLGGSWEFACCLLRLQVTSFIIFLWSPKQAFSLHW